MISRIPNIAWAALLLLLFLAAGAFGGPDSGLDRVISGWMAELRSEAPASTSLAATLTRLGSAPVTLGLTAAAAVWLLLRRNAGLALALIATVLGERLLVDALKNLVHRPRPELGEAIVNSMAYPSGHSANSMTAFLAIAVLGMPPQWRRAAAMSAIIVSLLVGVTRVYLGVHWPSDVIGGWALGLLSVGLAVTITRWSGALPLETQHQVVGRHRAAIGQDEAP